MSSKSALGLKLTSNQSLDTDLLRFAKGHHDNASIDFHQMCCDREIFLTAAAISQKRLILKPPDSLKSVSTRLEFDHVE